MLKTKNYKFWFCTGSQDLYGDECLEHVAEHAKIIVAKLNESGVLPYEVIWKPTLITNELIRKTFNEANMDEECAGVITWMHTFSPAKSWILGLQEYRKPLLHLHTQFNEEIPYDSIDMDFMNENQSAHGDREYGHIVTRMRIERKVVVGHWSDPVVQEKIASKHPQFQVITLPLLHTERIKQRSQEYCGSYRYDHLFHKFTYPHFIYLHTDHGSLPPDSNGSSS